VSRDPSKMQKENTERDKSERKIKTKKSSAFGWKIGTCVTNVQQKFSVYGKNGEK